MKALGHHGAGQKSWEDTLIPELRRE